MLFIIGNYSCERDDLCPDTTATTPKLVIESFDISNQEDSKNIFDLRIVGLDREDPLTVVLAGTESEINYDGSGDFSTVYLPLRTDADETVYRLIQEYAEDSEGNQTEGNEDTITISYDREDVYVSRACGFKTVFRNVTISRASDGDEWITLIQATNENQSVEDESEAHFNLFF